MKSKDEFTDTSEIGTLDEKDPFAGYEPLPGHENLGRAIVDIYGHPSGSPADYEFLRGVPDRSIVMELAEPADVETAVQSALESVFPAEQTASLSDRKSETST